MQSVRRCRTSEQLLLESTSQQKVTSCYRLLVLTCKVTVSVMSEWAYATQRALMQEEIPVIVSLPTLSRSKVVTRALRRDSKANLDINTQSAIFGK